MGISILHNNMLNGEFFLRLVMETRGINSSFIKASTKKDGPHRPLKYSNPNQWGQFPLIEGGNNPLAISTA